MKKLCISFLIIGIITLSAVIFLTPETKTEYLRLHIRANSNEQVDQNVKYLVKGAVVEYLTPFISTCDTKEKAERMLKENLSGIERVADMVLRENGFSYSSKASVKRENFPTRVYDGVTLEEGFYDALIINLGEGVGDNWWCVVYPPLCFVGSGNGNFKYKSKIIEIIDEWKSKNN